MIPEDQPISPQLAYYRRMTPTQKAAQVERNRNRRAARSESQKAVENARANETHAAWKKANPVRAKELRDAAAARRYADLSKRKVDLLHKLRHRAKKAGLAFNITVDDLHIPEVCPVLGIPLAFSIGEGRKAQAAFSSPSVDRVDNSQGYVKGNVRVISNRANLLKGSASLDEIARIHAYMRGDL